MTTCRTDATSLMRQISFTANWKGQSRDAPAFFCSDALSRQLYADAALQRKFVQTPAYGDVLESDAL